MSNISNPMKRIGKKMKQAYDYVIAVGIFILFLILLYVFKMDLDDVLGGGEEE